MQKVGIIGMGSIGIATGYILQQIGVSVLFYRPKNRNFSWYKTCLEKGNISIENTKKNSLPSGVLQAKITDNLADIICFSDLILHCGLFTQSNDNYTFSTKQKKQLALKKTPVLAFPGKLGSNWLIGAKTLQVGLVNYAPVFCTKEKTENTLKVSLLDFKKNIALTHPDIKITANLVVFFNRAFTSYHPTFYQGSSVLHTALSSPVTAINTIAICNCARLLTTTKANGIMHPIYALDKSHSTLFQMVFKTQQNVAKLLELAPIPDIHTWLKNRVSSPEKTIHAQLQEVYQHKKIRVTKTDRRLIEEYIALFFFYHFTKTLGITCLYTQKVLTLLEKTHKSLEINMLQEQKTHYKQQAISYAINRIENTVAQNKIETLLDIENTTSPL